MMSGEVIREIQADAARAAAESGQIPAVVWDNDSLAEDLRAMPNLGDYIPEGWRLAEAGEFEALPGSYPWQRNEPDNPVFFVDKTGWGERGESAMTVDQFESAARALVAEAAVASKTVGFGMVEEGQFQVYIGCFVRD